MNDSEYLQATNIIRLQAAARMAGLRWKSGAPDMNKAGIIAKLEQHPSIMRAAISVLQRMERGEMAAPQSTGSVNALMDDMADDGDSIPAPAANPAPQMQHAPNIDLSQYVKRPELTEFAKRVNSDLNKLADGMGAIVKAVSALQERRPVQINIPGHKAIVIDPSECHKSYPKLIKYMQINRRVILVGSAGTGKSMAVKNASADLDLPFYLVPPVTMSHELIGHRDAQGVFHETPLTLAFKHGGVCLLDEADASLPDALLCANPILDGNGFATLGDGLLHRMHENFIPVFNMNTDGNGATMQYAGRNRLDGATLARFGVRIFWEIDSRIEEKMSDGQPAWYRAVTAIRDMMVSRDISDVNATPRHTKTGAALLNAGCDRREVLDDCLKSGALGALWPDVQRLPAVMSFLKGN